MYFKRKNAETGQSFPHKLGTFLKYHISNFRWTILYLLYIVSNFTITDTKVSYHFSND